MIHLRTIGLDPKKNAENFPFNLPPFQHWRPLEFANPVTFLVGENGCGKSTLLEAIACAVGSITIGSESVKTDPTLMNLRSLGNSMKLTWNTRTHFGFFLRAEDFFGYIKQLSKIRSELEHDLRAVDKDYHDRSNFARELARMPYARELYALQNRYGDGLDLHSHGESYLELFQARFMPGGLYLLDEPEGALSPLRLLGFMSLLKEMVKRDAQFIIATHSPILMAFPGSTILHFDKDQLKEIAWDQLEHVTLTRDFLNNPESYLRHI